MSEDKSVSIFIRETVNDAGLHYVPGPVLEARQKSDLKLDLVLKDIAEKKPLVLGGKSVAFVLRKRKYPDSMGDIVYFATDSVMGRAYLEFNIPAGFLDLSVGEYWYDLVVGEEGDLLTDPLTRPPLGKFKVTK